MIVGIVNPSGDAIASLCIRGPKGALLELQTTIDTGFNGSLTLSRATAEFLELEYEEEIRYVLADGTEFVTHIVAVEVNWHGLWRDIRALEMDGGPLLGMSLLRNSTLRIDVIDGGDVEIRPLP